MESVFSFSPEVSRLLLELLKAAVEDLEGMKKDWDEAQTGSLKLECDDPIQKEAVAPSQHI